jgi:DNA invertase Pin-like site-specific DNA recombinase
MTEPGAPPIDDRVGQGGSNHQWPDPAGDRSSQHEPLLVSRPMGVMSPGQRPMKIQDRHLERLAIVYVRQSSPQQVIENRESRARQYALADYAEALGWPQSQVVVIDEDQGHSGSSAENRLGFQRLLAELTMDHVGLVLGLEMSRLARSSKDWHHLLELCALFGTLLGDQDGLYEPTDMNDRLLLGLKGTMSEVELFTMRSRLERGKLNKAQRGELFIGVPVGYVKLPSGQIALEPDEQARGMVQLIFDQFDEIGSMYGVFRYLVQHDLRLGLRVHHGPRRGELEWRLPRLQTVADILKHPLYAGAYVFGRRPQDARQRATGPKGGRWAPMDQWKVLIRDCLPSYITWDRYIANQQQLQQNRNLPTTLGIARNGRALLSGLAVCGTCGRRYQTTYGRANTPNYSCRWYLIKGQEQQCFGLAAAPLDALVVEQVLRALEPAALDLSIAAMESLEEERKRLHHSWQQQLDRASYDVQHAERQYQLVDPENRLVARTLEQRWEQTLRNQKQLEQEYDRFLRTQPPRLTEAERSRIRELASDIPTLWAAPGTTPADRKEIIRCVVERVVAHVEQNSEYVEVEIHWKGGTVSRHEIVRPVRLYTQLREYNQLMDRIEELRKAGHTIASICAQLDADGFVPPKRSSRFERVAVAKLMARRGLKHEKTVEPLGPNEWWLTDLAQHLDLSPAKLSGWARRGWIHGRRTPAQKLWILWADEDELSRLQLLQSLSARGANAGTYAEELRRPKDRMDGHIEDQQPETLEAS